MRTGPFKWVRHPIYAAMILGLLLVTESSPGHISLPLGCMSPRWALPVAGAQCRLPRLHAASVSSQ